MADVDDTPVAVIRIDRPGAMTPQGREDLAEWLRRAADQLVTDGAEYAHQGFFRYRYFGVRD
jgi:hypothetical protein